MTLWILILFCFSLADFHTAKFVVILWLKIEKLNKNFTNAINTVFNEGFPKTKIVLDQSLLLHQWENCMNEFSSPLQVHICQIGNL